MTIDIKGNIKPLAAHVYYCECMEEKMHNKIRYILAKLTHKIDNFKYIGVYK